MTMEYSWWTLLIIAPLVFLGGMLDAIAGGGGLIALPSYLIAGFAPYHAIATNKLASSIGTSVSAGRMIKNKCVDWPLVVPSAALAILGATVGAKLILSIDERLVRYMLLVILPVVAVIVLKKRDLDEELTGTVSRRKQFLIVCLFAFTVGMYDGFYGPGAGTFMLLGFTQLAKMPLRIASGNVRLANLASNLGSLVVFLINKQAIIPIGLVAAAFSIAGHYIGAGMLLKSGTKIVRPAIFSVLVLLFVRVINDLVTGG